VNELLFSFEHVVYSWTVLESFLTIDSWLRQKRKDSRFNNWQRLLSYLTLLALADSELVSLPYSCVDRSDWSLIIVLFSYSSCLSWILVFLLIPELIFSDCSPWFESSWLSNWGWISFILKLRMFSLFWTVFWTGLNPVIFDLKEGTAITGLNWLIVLKESIELDLF